MDQIQSENQTVFYKDKLDETSPTVQAALEIWREIGQNGFDKARAVSIIIQIVRKTLPQGTRSTAEIVAEMFCRKKNRENEVDKVVSLLRIHGEEFRNS